jgi:hypothetical protein
MAPPQKLTIIWDNRKFDAAVLTPSSAALGFPASAVQDQLRQRTWRTLTLTNEKLVVDFGESLNCACVALVNHNLGLSGQVRVQAADVADFSTLLKNVLYDVWPAGGYGGPAGAPGNLTPPVGFGECGYGEGAYGGAVDQTYYPPNPVSSIYFDAPVQARYWALLPLDPANPNGFFQIGRIFLSLYDTYARRPGYGWGFSYQDDSTIVRSTGGQPWTDRRQPYRVLRLPWKAFANADKYWQLAFFLNQVGLSRDFIIDAFPGAPPPERFFTTLYGRVSGSSSNFSGASTTPEITADEAKYSGFELTVVESL